MFPLIKSGTKKEDEMGKFNVNVAGATGRDARLKVMLMATKAISRTQSWRQK